jgi:hypothetical protein
VKDPDKGVSVVLAVLPFGMFAALAAGSMAILMPYFLAMLTTAAFLLRRFSGQIPGIRLSRSGIWLLLFGVYSVFSAIFLVRLFAGSFLVFPLTFDLLGTKVSTVFHSTMKPLSPVNSNISQTSYALLSVLFFIVAADVFRRRGPAILETGLVWAAGLNIMLGALDFAGADGVLSLVRTADYALGNEQRVFGLPRVIGGFSEGAAFGAFSAAMFGYFAPSYLIGRQARHGVLAAGNAVCTLLAFSSTGYAALIFALVLLVLHSRRFLGRGLSRSFGHWLVILASFAVLALCVAAVATPLMTTIGDIADRLFLQKAGSASGLERGAWARSGLNAFVQTWGLGAGVGSLRANGLASVFLGSVGIPGTLFFLGFLWSALGPVPPIANPNGRRLFCAGRVGALTGLGAMMVSATTPDPTLILVSLAAIASVARQYDDLPARTAARPPVPLRGASYR